MTVVEHQSEFTAQVVIVGNYRPDRQQSMLRFADVLTTELRTRGCTVRLLSPRPVFGLLCPAAGGLRKWAGYVDKYLVFPLVLRHAVRSARRHGTVIAHICDHSNAIYTRYLQDVRHVVTCNDLLAVRSARGEIATNPTRWSGRLLQRMILAGLNRADHIVCISEATRRDVMRLCSPRNPVQLVYMGLNFAYQRVDSELAHHRIAKAFGVSGPFILHVGGNQWYKNRLGVLRIYAELKRTAGAAAVPRLVLVGPAFTARMREFIAGARLDNDVVELQQVASEDLRSLYSAAELLLYPSMAEGFGWPVLEAMACGCRVIATGREPITEVAGDAATYIDPDDVPRAAAATRAVLAESTEARSSKIELGLRRHVQFSTSEMIDRYVAVYRSLVATGGRSHGAPVAAA